LIPLGVGHVGVEARDAGEYDSDESQGEVEEKP